MTGSEARRRRAAELFAAGVRQAEVARQLGVSAQDVSVWRARFTGGGTEALRSRGPGGPAPRLSDARLDRVGQALLEGATANGFTGAVDAGTDRARDRTADQGPTSSGARVDTAARSAGLQMSLYSAVYTDRDVPYQEPSYYGDITEPTVGLVRFMGAVARRLGTKATGGKALFHLDQGMGGGKSHALVGLFHLANDPAGFLATDLWPAGP